MLINDNFPPNVPAPQSAQNGEPKPGSSTGAQQAEARY